MLVSFELAKIAKELGFNTQGWEDPTQAYYNKEGNIVVNLLEEASNYILAPTLAELQRWVREVLKIHIMVDWEGTEPDETSNNKWCWYSGKLVVINQGTDSCGNGFNTYEEALENGLLNTLKK